MIHTKGLATTITCGKNGKGSVCVTGKAGDWEAHLILQQIIGEDIPIGGTPKPTEIGELPSVTIHFFDIKSVEVYIKALEAIKKRMENRHMYALAC